MRHRTVCFRSSSQHSPDVLIGRLFLGRSPPRLLNAAAPGGLKPTPESRLREALSHLRYSSAGFPPTFVTHLDTDTCPRPSPLYMSRRFDSSCWSASDVAGSVCSTRVHTPAPSAKCNWHPPPHHVRPATPRHVRTTADIGDT